VGKEDRCASPVRNLVWDRKRSNHLFPALLSYLSSNGENNEGEQWDCDLYLYAVNTPGTNSAAMAYTLWYNKMNSDCSCKESKRWCRY